MASLKEIKRRINSINGTLKITSAMKLVASSKFRKAQNAIGNLLPYEKRMYSILADLLSSGIPGCDKYLQVRSVRKVAVVAFSSNSSLCGAFNSSAARHLSEVVSEYMSQGLSKEDIMVFAVGRKMVEAARKMGIVSKGDYIRMADNPSYEETSQLAGTLIDMFLSGDVDKVELVYNHCKSSASQIPVRETYLPLSLDKVSDDLNPGNVDDNLYVPDYIVEPGLPEVLSSLLPKVLLLKIYAVMLDANAAEHAARMVAMQVASDNGTQLLQDITLQYNKQRQQAITDELQDIIGGTMV